ncbi:MAG: FtsQ-type POTRA domain-containing protein [Pseudomonadales bacterium]|nr:FtsQ-type POTRA domain-containing protein [Pseudomonadales bacterium]
MNKSEAKNRSAKAKRPQQKTTTNKKPLAFLAAVSLFVVVLLTAPIMLHNTFDNFPIRSVKVSGEFFHLNEKKLQKRLEKHLIANYFNVNLLEVREAAEALPWIEKAWVKKEWPDSVVIRIEERVAVANWGKNQLISKHHEIFSSDEVKHLDQLPTFYGIDEYAPLMLNRFNEMKSKLQPLGLGVKTLKLEDRFSWHVTLNDGLRLVIDEVDFIKKLERFVELYQTMPSIDRPFIEQADLRYENGLAIKWKKKDGKSDAA